MTHPPQEPSTTPEPWTMTPQPPTTPVPPPAAHQSPAFAPGSASVPQPPSPPAGYPPPYHPGYGPSVPGPAGYPPPYQAPAYGPPMLPSPTAPPKRRTGLVVALVVGLVVVLLGGAVTGVLFLLPTGKRSTDTQQASAETPGPGSTTSAAAVPTAANTSAAPTAAPAATRFTGDLRTLLVPRPPGSRPLVELAGHDGKLDDLAETLTFFQDGQDWWRDAFEYNLYQRGAVTGWYTDDFSVRILMFQFKSNLDARAFLNRLDSGILGFDDQGEMAGIPGSMLFTEIDTARAKAHYTESVFRRGDIAIHISMEHSGKPDAAVATALALIQYNRLPEI